ncbi:TcpQ domain-containing protein [Metallibacterium scheffleri]|nr:TcpQ domain-containing protein [Metallibacterium scheffleri]
MLALSVMAALTLVSIGAQAAGETWSAPVNDATGKPVPIVLPATTSGFEHAEPAASSTAAAPHAMHVRRAPASPWRAVPDKAAPSALPDTMTRATGTAGNHGQTGVPDGVTALPQIPAGDLLVITARAPARAAPLSRRELDVLNARVKRVLTPAGHTTVSYASHSITVSDTPAGERGVEGYLAHINSRPAVYGYRVRYHVEAPQVPLSGVAMSTPATPPFMLKPGETLSHALAQYVALHGWKLVWSIKNDYVLSDPFPIPGRDDVISGVSYVVKAYQAQGGLLGDAPVFAVPNHVVVIRPMTVSMEQAR